MCWLLLALGCLEQLDLLQLLLLLLLMINLAE